MNHEKEKLLRDVLNYFNGITGLSKTLGVHYQTVHNWIKYRGINSKGALLIELHSNRKFKAIDVYKLKKTNGNSEGNNKNDGYHSWKPQPS